LRTNSLVNNLKSYWAQYPGKKVVLFSFFRDTLRYLGDRLLEDGVQSVTVHGQIDKQDALQQFERSAEANILLSSEVAAEGVDLQFSSLVVNYDLPWNPAKIEQRIGRIDRIGQEAEKILIWNLVYEDTVDDRVYERLPSARGEWTCFRKNVSREPGTKRFAPIKPHPLPKVAVETLHNAGALQLPVAFSILSRHCPSQDGGLTVLLLEQGGHHL
jgi:ERCC4-related helicase